MFEVGHGRNIQIVDSAFILHLLCERIALARWFEGYSLGLSIGHGSLKGIFLEQCIHRWFAENRPSPITGVIWADGSHQDSIQLLNQPNHYWVPKSPNFPDIDSAVYIDSQDTLYAFQITCTQASTRVLHELFRERFVKKVQLNFGKCFRKVHVIFLVPMESTLTVSAGVHADIECTKHYVDMRTMNLLHESMKSLPFLVEPPGVNAFNPLRYLKFW
jgi:hypothetical protein